MIYTNILFEFYTMHTNLSSKQCLIIYAEVPIDLLGNTQRKRTRDLNSGTEPIPKKTKGGDPQGTSNPKTWHSLLKGNLTSPIEVSIKPYSSEVLKYCGETVDEFYPLIDSKCAPNDLFGKIYIRKKCPLQSKATQLFAGIEINVDTQ